MKNKEDFSEDKLNGRERDREREKRDRSRERRDRDRSRDRSRDRDRRDLGTLSSPPLRSGGLLLVATTVTYIIFSHFFLKLDRYDMVLSYSPL